MGRRKLRKVTGKYERLLKDIKEITLNYLKERKLQRSFLYRERC
jgi:hypothetical protein